MMTTTALTRERREMYRRIRAAVAARRLSAAVSADAPADEPPPQPQP